MPTEPSGLPTAFDYLRNSLDLTEVSLQPSRPSRKRLGSPRASGILIDSTPTQDVDRFLQLMLEELGKNLTLPIEEDRFPTVEQIEDWFDVLDADAESAGNPVPSRRVVEEAKRIALALRPLLPLDTDVHTWDDGEVAIEVFGVRRRGFLLLCEPGGSALCIVTINNISRRSRYESSARDLPDGFLREGLREVLSLV